LKQVLSAQRKCIRCRGNESLTRVTQKIVTATRKQSLKGNVQSPLLFTAGKRGPLTQMRIARGRLKKRRTKSTESSKRERGKYLCRILHRIAMFCRMN